MASNREVRGSDTERNAEKREDWMGKILHKYFVYGVCGLFLGILVLHHCNIHVLDFLAEESELSFLIFIISLAAAVTISAVERTKDAVREVPRRVDDKLNLGALKESVAGISQDFGRILNDNGLAEVQVFKNVDEFYNTLAARIADAHEVHAVNFIPQPPNKPPSRVRYYQVLEDVIKSNSRACVRRIAAIVHQEKREWFVKDQVKKFKDCRAFSAAAIKCDPLEDVPLLTIILVDDDEVFMGMYWGGKAVADMEHNIRIISSKIRDAFSEYYKSLWEHNNTVECLVNGEIQKGNLNRVEQWDLPKKPSDAE